MRPLQRLIVVASIAFIGTLSASAHPGHGEPGPAHYVTEADHVVPVVLATTAILFCVVAVLALRKKAVAAVARRSDNR